MRAIFHVMFRNKKNPAKELLASYLYVSRQEKKRKIRRWEMEANFLTLIYLQSEGVRG